jgi:hypothetical protein
MITRKNQSLKKSGRAYFMHVSLRILEVGITSSTGTWDLEIMLDSICEKFGDKSSRSRIRIVGDG